MQIFENDYLIFEVNEAKKIFTYTWKAKSEELNTEDYLINTQKILEAFLESGYDKALGNDEYFLVIVEPEIQVEVNKTILVHLSGKLTKFAHVLSSELFSKISVQQLFEENTEKTYEDKYFESLEEAQEWIEK